MKENHLYECIYDVLQRDPSTQNTCPILNCLKAKIVRIHNIQMQRLLLDTEEADRLESEWPTLYHTLQMKQRHSQRTIHNLRYENGQLQTTPRGTVYTMTFHFRKMYDIIDTDSDGVKTLMDAALHTRINQYRGAFEMPFEKEEIYNAIQAGGRGKAPEEDGLGKEFYERNWPLIQDDLCKVLNQMFWAGKITSRQKHGVLICLPKPRGNQMPVDYHPITLINYDYKILARLNARRLRPVMEDHLTHMQYCGIPGNTILNAMATVHDSIAYAENRNIPLCVLSLDFKNAFDRVLHGYLFQILHRYGISAPFINGIRHM